MNSEEKKPNYFKDKNILITGGTGGIGSLLVKRLLDKGARIFLLAHTMNKVTDLYQDEIDNKPDYFKYKLIDFSSQRITPNDFKEIMQFFKGYLDILLLCHGRYNMGNIESTDPKEFDEAFAVNVRSCFNILSLSTPFLKLTKGCVVAISSQEASIPVLSGMLNTVTKSMLNSLIQNSALELASFGVRVNGVAPGITNTQMRVGINEQFGENENKEFMDRIGSYFPLGEEVVSPEDIVEAILFLASDEAGFMTGEIITVDGGYSLNHDLCFSEQ